jgi:hypothetical protein
VGLTRTPVVYRGDAAVVLPRPPPIDDIKPARRRRRRSRARRGAADSSFRIRDYYGDDARRIPLARCMNQQIVRLPDEIPRRSVAARARSDRRHHTWSSPSQLLDAVFALVGARMPRRRHVARAAIGKRVEIAAARSQEPRRLGARDLASVVPLASLIEPGRARSSFSQPHH